MPNGLIGDPLRLRQILINLVNNSVKFTDEGEIIIRISLVENERDNKQESQENNNQQVTLKFSVQDTGIGMTPDQISKLFQSFGQADSSTTRKYGGTGLGLTISKTLTELMGGKIWVESSAGLGSTFSFTAKFGLSDEIDDELVQPIIDVRGLSVLLVDDSPSAREILHNLAQSLTFAVDQVASGEEALEKVKQADITGQPYKIVFMDWKMPGMNGIETYEHIINDSKLAAPPKVVMVTAYDKDEIRETIQSRQPDGLLSKPVNASSLLDAVMVAMGHEQQQKVTQSNKLAFDLVADRSGARILLVDDNEVNQQIGLELLELVQMDVTLADNGKSAVELIKSNNFDLVLMDIQMPIMDGFEATREIRKDNKYRNLPIIAMTANALNTDKEKCFNAGMNEHISKPIDPNILYKSLAQWIAPITRELPPRLVNKSIIHDSLVTVKSLVTAKSEKLTTEYTANNESIKLNLPEFDVDNALMRMGGSMSSYRKILQKMLDSEHDAMIRLEVSVKEGDINSAIRIVHTLKGLAGSIGAVDLQSVSSALEDSLNKNNGIVDTVLFNKTKALLAETITIINDALHHGQIVDIEAKNESDLTTTLREINITDTSVVTDLQKIADDIENCDASTEDKVEQLLTKISDPALIKILEQVQSHLIEYEFDKAEPLFTTLMKGVTKQN